MSTKDIHRTLRTIHNKCSGAAKYQAAKMAVGSTFSEGSLKLEDMGETITAARQVAIDADFVSAAAKHKAALLIKTSFTDNENNAPTNPEAQLTLDEKRVIAASDKANEALWAAYEEYNRASQGIFDDAKKNGTMAAARASFYDDSMYSDDTPKNIALARLAVLSSIKDVHEGMNLLTPGQITTAIDAAPLIVGRRGMEELASITNDEQMFAFIEKNGSGYETGIMAAAQTWSLFHTGCKGGWPNKLFWNSDITPEGAALVGLVSHHLYQGDLENSEIDAHAMISGLVAKARMTAELAENGKALASPTSPEDIAATFIHLAKDGQFAVLDDSGLAAELPPGGPMTKKLSKEYGLARHPSAKTGSLDEAGIDAELEAKILEETGVVQTNKEAEQDEVISNNTGGDGGFLGYKSFGALKRDFSVASLASAAEYGISIYKGHPATHHAFCACIPWIKCLAGSDKDFDGDDVISVYNKGYKIFQEQCSPFVAAKFRLDTGFDKRDYAEEFMPPGPSMAVATFPSGLMPTAQNIITFSTPEEPVTPDAPQYICSRFADANQHSKKYILELFGMSMVNNPTTQLFSFMKAEYRSMVENGVSYDEALDAVKENTVNSFVEDVMGKLPEDASQKALADARQKVAERESEVLIYSQYLGGAAFESLDAQIGDTKSDGYNDMAISDAEREEHSASIGMTWVDGEKVPENFIETSSIGRDEGSEKTGDRVGKWFKQIRKILVDKDYDELAEAVDGLAHLRLPTQDESEAIDRVLRLRSPNEKTGKRLASIFNTSVESIQKALVAETRNTEDMFTGGLRKASEEISNESPFRIENTAKRMTHMLAAASRINNPEVVREGR